NPLTPSLSPTGGEGGRRPGERASWGSRAQGAIKVRGNLSQNRPCSTGKDAVHFLRQLLQPFRAVGPALLGDAPAIVADVVKRLHHRGPIVVAFQEFDVETLSQPLMAGLVTAEFLDVQFLNAFAQNA